MSNKTRTTLAALIVALALAALLVLACQPDDAPDGIGRGIGILDVTNTPTANFAYQCAEDQENSFTDGAWRCWNPWANTDDALNYDYDGPLYKEFEGGDAWAAGAVIRPDADWGVQKIEMLVGYSIDLAGKRDIQPLEEFLCRLKIAVYEEGIEDGAPGDFVASVVNNYPCNVSGEYPYEWECPITGIFTPTFVLEGNQAYWLMVEADTDAGRTNAFCFHAKMPYATGGITQALPLPLPVWIEGAAYCDESPDGDTLDGCTAIDTSYQVPIAIYGDYYVETPEPTETPTPQIYYYTEILGSQGPTPTPTPTP
jgi:hypothetical protein